MQEINMMVSGIIRKKDQKYVHVSFQRGKDTAEFILPECSLKKSQGFNQEELEKLSDYVKGSQAEIMEQARKINPMKAMLGLSKE